MDHLVSERTQEFLKALASENRQRIVMLFADGRARSVGEVAAEVGIGQSTASEQLTLLRRGGVVRAERDGKTVRYFADGAGIAAALTELQQVLARCCPPGPRTDGSGCGGDAEVGDELGDP